MASNTEIATSFINRLTIFDEKNPQSKIVPVFFTCMFTSIPISYPLPPHSYYMYKEFTCKNHVEMST